MGDAHEKWNAESITDARLNENTHLTGTTSQRTASTAWPTTALWFDTDLGRLFRNTGTEGSPTSTLIGGILTGTVLPTAANSNTDDMFYLTHIPNGLSYFDGTDWFRTSDLEKYGFTATGDIDLDFTEYANQTAFDNAWVSNDTGKLRGNPTNDNIDFEIVADATADLIYFDMDGDLGGNLDAAKWVIRFKINFTTVTSGNNGAFLACGPSDNTAVRETNQDALGGVIEQLDGGGQLNWGGADADGGAAWQLMETKTARTFVTGTDYYFELARESISNLRVKLFSDAAYTTQLDSTVNHATTSGVQALRYFKIWNRNISGTGTLIGTLDNFQVWDGVNIVA